MNYDKRKYPRSPASLETIYFTENRNTDDDRLYFPGTITNKSIRGLGLRVTYQHTKDDQIWLEGISGTTNQARLATVRWISNNGNDEYLMGIEFSADTASR